MAEPETVALVALLRIGRRPWPIYAELLEGGDSAHDVLEHELSEDDHGQRTLSAANDTRRLLDDATADIAAWKAVGIRLLTVLDRDYPANLSAVHDRPPLLFVAGSIKPADNRSLAVIGSRTPSAAGIERAQTVAGHLADDGYTVISGLAAGIDTAAHTAALARNARTIAVIGTGLKHSYPPENAALQETIVARSAVVSQFWPDAQVPAARASRCAMPSCLASRSGRSWSRRHTRAALASRRGSRWPTGGPCSSPGSSLTRTGRARSRLVPGPRLRCPGRDHVRR